MDPTPVTGPEPAPVTKSTDLMPASGAPELPTIVEPELPSPGVEPQSLAPPAIAASETPPTTLPPEPSPGPPTSQLRVEPIAGFPPPPPAEPTPLAPELPPPPSLAVGAAPPAPSIAEALGFPPIENALTVPAPEAPPAPPTGGIDLAVGPSYFPSLERFLEATAAGHQGICVVRDSPERVRAYVGSRPVEIRWLTNIGRGPTLKPSDLDGFSAFLAHAVSTGHVTAFFLEGVEYLVRLHGLDRVVERMVDFDRLAREHSARVWVPLNPKLLSPAELDRFVTAFGGGTPIS